MSTDQRHIDAMHKFFDSAYKGDPLDVSEAMILELISAGLIERSPHGWLRATDDGQMIYMGLQCAKQASVDDD